MSIPIKDNHIHSEECSNCDDNTHNHSKECNISNCDDKHIIIAKMRKKSVKHVVDANLVYY